MISFSTFFGTAPAGAVPKNSPCNHPFRPIEFHERGGHYPCFSWIPVITSVSALWFMMAMIFIYGYMRKKRQAEQRLREMAEEEGQEGTWDPNG
jgi:hypothetical protein